MYDCQPEETALPEVPQHSLSPTTAMCEGIMQ